MNKKLIELFYDCYKPCNVPPILGLSRKFILKNGFTIEDIESLISYGFIEEYGENKYRMTENTMKEWMSENTYVFKSYLNGK